MTTFQFVIAVMPRDGILDPQGRAVFQNLPHLGVTTARDVRVGRRVELILDAADEDEARTIVERLAGELFSNPLIETATVELVAASSSIAVEAVR